ncbi:MAG: ShlB/FhaC/HecB family hemolysin secretion/activation protein, partial [Elainella sp.]
LAQIERPANPSGPPLIPPVRIPEPNLPDQPLPTLPPPEDLLPAPLPVVPEAPDLEVPVTVRVERFEVTGSTVFDAELLAEVARRAVAPDPADTETPPDGSRMTVDRELSFSDVLQARSAITQYYVERGYVTSGAIIPQQRLSNSVIRIQVIEGRLEAINISGTRRLRPAYLRSRIALAVSTPLNVNRLLEGLQLLQLDPLIATINADLQAGSRPATSVLEVQVLEADSFSATLDLNNDRSPSVGSFERGLELAEANLTGWGDRLSFSYANTDGSNTFDASYTLPINPRNGTVQLAAGVATSEVIEPVYDRDGDGENDLDITSESQYLELSVRQPLIQTVREEFALGITASYQNSETELSIDSDFGGGLEPTGFPISAGATEDGQTRVTALRLFQDYTQRSSQHVLAFRSQFSLGLDLLGEAPAFPDEPNRSFFSWRGQGQWVRLLAPETLLLVRGDVQLADAALVPVEQFGLGGRRTVRGYRQDALLTDNGALFSTELRIPILRFRDLDSSLQIAPFLDVGTGWNLEANNPDPNLLVGTGLGLLWQTGDYFAVRLDWGLPLVTVDSEERTWQENGIYFSVLLTPL